MAEMEIKSLMTLICCELWVDEKNRKFPAEFFPLPAVLISFGLIALWKIRLLALQACAGEIIFSLFVSN